eukprot:5951782-Amphidinium_carterae.1
MLTTALNVALEVIAIAQDAFYREFIDPDMQQETLGQDETGSAWRSRNLSLKCRRIALAGRWACSTLLCRYSGVSCNSSLARLPSRR